MHFLSVPGVSVGTSGASQRTKRRRMEAVAQVRDSLSMTLKDEVKGQKRQELLEDIQLPVVISSKDILAIKSCLSLSWSTVRKLRE